MKIISIISILIVCGLLLMNYQDTAGITLLSSKIAQFIHIAPKSVTLNMSVYTLLIFLLGQISAICFFAPLYFSLKEKYKAYKRELEKDSISNTTNESKIAVLENKITVLEKALEEALKQQKKDN